jgi:succinate dehydrogenase / fumarate reductase cytochrome b subunit
MRVPERTPESLRRLHSLTGVVPLGFFLLEHIAVNATALAGRGAFRRAVEALDRTPLLPVLEIAFIALPLAIHSVIGVLLATELNEAGRLDLADRRVAFQRVTGILLLPYLIYHVWSTRFSPEVLRGGADLLAVMAKQVASVPGFAFHALGIALAAYHLGHGLRSFAVRWGLARDAAAERTVERLGLGLAVVLTVVGVASLAAFARHAVVVATLPAGSGGVP